MNINTNNAESTLRLNDIYVCKASYQTHLNNHEKSKLGKYAFKCSIQKEDELFNIYLSTIIKSEEESAELFMEICGVFSIVGEIDEKISLDELLTKNAVAIMFPYLRTYISTLSSMTSMGMINIPIFNLVKAFSQSNKDTNEDEI